MPPRFERVLMTMTSVSFDEGSSDITDDRLSTCDDTESTFPDEIELMLVTSSSVAGLFQKIFLAKTLLFHSRNVGDHLFLFFFL